MKNHAFINSCFQFQVQVKPGLKACLVSMLETVLKLKCDELLSNFAFNFNCLRLCGKEMKGKLRKFFLHMMNKTISDAFMTWFQMWEDVVRARAESKILGELDAVKEQRLRMFLKKLMNSAIAGAWEKWMELHSMIRTIKVEHTLSLSLSLPLSVSSSLPLSPPPSSPPPPPPLETTIR